VALLRTAHALGSRSLGEDLLDVRVEIVIDHAEGLRLVA
jgi:hypothetical protein